ncbi:MAG: Asp-tRNA(Asn)/Glu-tRNA(Gln) amidotransferase subunit GatC [Parcubacteria group bacterium]|nr:Asp-tRNA(Asn)/Glu-tRNA(Gln) amidotransferase subunit GatC [Parcubacteria group bacterium]
MSLSKDDVLKVAKLARIELSEAEVDKFQGQLSAVLSYIEQLQKVDTKNVPITAQVTGLENVMRDDKAVPAGEGVREALLDEAPQRGGDLVRVTSVF